MNRNALMLHLAGVPATASTAAEWRKERGRAAAARVQAVDVSGGRTTPVAAFDDRTGMDAMLVTGVIHRGPAHRDDAVPARSPDEPCVRRRDVRLAGGALNP